MTENNVESFLEKFKEIEDKKVQLEAEKKLLEDEKKGILFELGKTDVEDIQKEMSAIAAELESLLQSLEMPQEILDELKDIDRKS